jgi:ElaB/YqjD/DUF883 family membrane-anchored ribosome-binding protein
MSGQTTPKGGEAVSALKDFKDMATDQVAHAADMASDKFRTLADQAEHVAGRVIEQGRVVGHQVNDVAGNLQGAVKKSVTEQPMVTLAIAAVAGFVLGALWKK